MNNPWLDLPAEPDYILASDNNQVLHFASRQKENAKLQLKSIPEPFIGSPETARVVLLLLNPGHKKEDTDAHRNPDLKKALFRNLRGEPQTYPFYPLNPEFSWAPTAKWWVPRTLKLKQATGLTDAIFSEKLLAIEWFPYHSRSSGLPISRVCDSQSYTFELVKTSMKKNRFILRMRSAKHWGEVDPRLRDISALKNPRCSYITRGNTEPGVFERIVTALK